MTQPPIFQNTYATLPERFFARLAPTPVAAPRLIALNRPLAHALGLDPHWLESPDGLAFLSGNAVPTGASPLAQAYAGHQFGHFNPQLGDGRANLLGEISTPDGRQRDIQLKGSGRTPFSRNGDGRAALGPVLREYIVSEAMHALGIPTTRALAAISTGEPVLRETVLPGAILTRIASSHIRVGTFQYFAARQDTEALETLTQYALDRHYPAQHNNENPALALLNAVIAAQSSLIAQWMGIGFIHGVMNTDNSAISGETIDYGPCAFMDRYNPATVFSFIDENGRYAYQNQPSIALWNLTRLAEALLPLIDPNENTAIEYAQTALAKFEPSFQAHFLRIMRAKLGLLTKQDNDAALIRAFLNLMHTNDADFTRSFRALSHLAENPDDPRAQDEFTNPDTFRDWAETWHTRLAQETVSPHNRAARMKAANPALIPRNHQIEAAIKAAVSHNDFHPFERLTTALATPYTETQDFADLALPPTPEERVTNTFCGT